MTTNTITQLTDPHGFSPDPLTDILRSGARHLIQQAVEAEFSALLEAHESDRTDDGRARLVRHGHLPEREVITGIGAVPVKVPRVRDRGNKAEKVRFETAKLNDLDPQAYLADILDRIHDHKINRLDELLPWNWKPAGEDVAKAA